MQHEQVHIYTLNLNTIRWQQNNGYYRGVVSYMLIVEKKMTLLWKGIAAYRVRNRRGIIWLLWVSVMPAHWAWKKITATLQTIFPNTFLELKVLCKALKLWLKFVLGVRCRQAKQVKSQYLKQCWPDSYIRYSALTSWYREIYCFNLPNGQRCVSQFDDIALEWLALGCIYRLKNAHYLFNKGQIGHLSHKHGWILKSVLWKRAFFFNLCGFNISGGMVTVSHHTCIWNMQNKRMSLQFPYFLYHCLR